MRLRSGLAPALCRVIERCLAKAPAARFQTAADVVAALEGKPEAESCRGGHRSDDLRKAGLAVGEPDTKSIVVFPFANLSPDADTEYFSDGLADEIITDLSRGRALGGSSGPRRCASRRWGAASRP